MSGRIVSKYVRTCKSVHFLEKKRKQERELKWQEWLPLFQPSPQDWLIDEATWGGKTSRSSTHYPIDYLSPLMCFRNAPAIPVTPPPHSSSIHSDDFVNPEYYVRGAGSDVIVIPITYNMKIFVRKFQNTRTSKWNCRLNCFQLLFSSPSNMTSGIVISSGRYFVIFVCFREHFPVSVNVSNDCVRCRGIAFQMTILWITGE